MTMKINSVKLMFIRELKLPSMAMITFIIAEIGNYSNVFRIVLYIIKASEGIVLASLYAITANRLIIVIFPFWYRRVMNKKRYIKFSGPIYLFFRTLDVE